ncbi:MAG: hypothetical protein FWD63_07580 [Propionibacteriaceae bacterium]|nr:hypothetical protein [Propionibacteriaceae bacterium]
MTPTASHPRLSGLARWAFFWTLFIGLGAVLGTGMMWTAPNKFGMGPLLDQMRANLPLGDVFFTSFTWPGVFLLVIIGLPNLVEAILIMRHHRVAPVGAVACGVILIVWTLIEIFWAFGPNFASYLYLVLGLAQAVMGVLWMRRR